MLMLMIDLFWMLMLYLISIPLDKTSDICVNKLFQNTKTLFKGNSKTDFFDLLNLANKESFFFTLTASVAMRSSIGILLAKIFLSHYEKTGLINLIYDYMI